MYRFQLKRKKDFTKILLTVWHSEADKTNQAKNRINFNITPTATAIKDKSRYPIIIHHQIILPGYGVTKKVIPSILQLQLSTSPVASLRIVSATNATHI